VKPIDEAQAAWLLTVSEGTRLYVPILIAVCAGIRRGEILAVRWSDIDRERAVLTISQALEESTAGIAFKQPKGHKRRSVAIPALLLEALRVHHAKQQEYRAALGAGYQDHGLVCCVEDSSIWKPSAFTSAYRDLLKRRKLSGPNFHALTPRARLAPSQEWRRCKSHQQTPRAFARQLHHGRVRASDARPG